MFIALFLFFFFSSRRRHTRFDCDWSSDVCSSDLRRYAEMNQIPWVIFRKGDRKLDVMRPYLEAAEKAGRSEVVAIGEAREFQWVFDATRKEGPDGVPWFRFYRTERLEIGRAHV